MIEKEKTYTSTNIYCKQTNTINISVSNTIIVILITPTLILPHQSPRFINVILATTTIPTLSVRILPAHPGPEERGTQREGDAGTGRLGGLHGRQVLSPRQQPEGQSEVSFGGGGFSLVGDICCLGHVGKIICECTSELVGC